MVNFGHFQREVCTAAGGSKASSVRVLLWVQTSSGATAVCVLREAEFNLAAWPLAVAS